jgi:hypothetical protein
MKNIILIEKLILKQKQEFNEREVDSEMLKSNYKYLILLKGIDGTWDPSSELQPVPSSGTTSTYILAN